MKPRTPYYHSKPRQGAEAVGITVSRRDNEPIEVLIRRFKKKCLKHGIIRDIMEKEFYVKPSTKRRIEKKKSILRCKKNFEQAQSLLPLDKAETRSLINVKKKPKKEKIKYEEKSYGEYQFGN